MAKKHMDEVWPLFDYYVNVISGQVLLNKTTNNSD